MDPSHLSHLQYPHYFHMEYTKLNLWLLPLLHCAATQIQASDAARTPNVSCCIAFCFAGVPILLSFFELSLLFSCAAAAAAATWQYK